MGLFDFLKKEDNKEKKEKDMTELIDLLAKEGKTKLGSFKCFRCKKIFPIRFYACQGLYKDNNGHNVSRANCRFCLEKDKDRGITMAWGMPIETTMLTGEILAQYFNQHKKRKDKV